MAAAIAAPEPKRSNVVGSGTGSGSVNRYWNWFSPPTQLPARGGIDSAKRRAGTYQVTGEHLLATGDPRICPLNVNGVRMKKNSVVVGSNLAGVAAKSSVCGRHTARPRHPRRVLRPRAARRERRPHDCAATGVKVSRQRLPSNCDGWLVSLKPAAAR